MTGLHWTLEPERVRSTPYGVAPPLREVSREALPVTCGLPNGGQATIPGLDWPALSIAQGGGGSPPVAVVESSKEVVNGLLEAWGHALGPCRRPFGREDYALVVKGRPVAVAVSASTVSAPVYGGLRRRDVVELARLCRAPDEPHALRALLRLWRAYLAPAWGYWPVKAAVAYALPGKTGDLYRFDGWRKVRVCKPSGGGGTWSGPSATDSIADGIKTLWTYEYGGA